MNEPINQNALADRRITAVDRAAISILGVATFAFLTAVGAQIRIPLPFTPVPLTLQTFFVILAGAYLGRHRGSLSQMVYIVLGAAGLPFFAGSSSSAAAAVGWGRLLGPTGGYLIGFIVAAYFIGWALELTAKSRSNFIWTSGVMIAGSMLILVFGSAWLAVLLKGDLVKAFVLGMWPFLPGDILKSLTAASLVTAFKKR